MLMFSAIYNIFKKGARAFEGNTKSLGIHRAR